MARKKKRKLDKQLSWIKDYVHSTNGGRVRIKRQRTGRTGRQVEQSRRINGK